MGQVISQVLSLNVLPVEDFSPLNPRLFLGERISSDLLLSNFPSPVPLLLRAAFLIS